MIEIIKKISRYPPPAPKRIHFILYAAINPFIDLMDVRSDSLGYTIVYDTY